MKSAICHSFEKTHRRDAVAALLHSEFWTEVPGASAAKMPARLGQTSTADAFPL